jgi:hypothetical protein
MIASEIGYFIRPKQSKWKALAQDIACALAIVAFVSLLLWLASIGAF